MMGDSITGAKAYSNQRIPTPQATAARQLKMEEQQQQEQRYQAHACYQKSYN
jgi:hypothetical protein